MKSKFILSVMVFIIISVHGYGQPFEQSNADNFYTISCPDSQRTDIFLVGYVLTNHQNKIKRKKTGVGEYNFDRSEIGELGPDTPEKLRKYWEKRGVVRITKPGICHEISEVLRTENRLKDLGKDYRRLYYKVKDKYLIMHLPRDTMIDGPSAPILIMDNNYNIIAYF